MQPTSTSCRPSSNEIGTVAASESDLHVAAIRWAAFAALGLFALLFTACGSGDDPTAASDAATAPPTSQSADASTAPAAEVTPTPDANDFILPVTLNVNLTQNGPQPEQLFVPSNQYVQIIFRNRALGEYHYEVLGLEPESLVWKSVPEDAVEREVDITDEDHEAHHDLDYVPWRAESSNGIQPNGEEVHGYVEPGELDVVRFIARDIGTYDVIDPLHPEFSAQLIVY